MKWIHLTFWLTVTLFIIVGHQANANENSRSMLQENGGIIMSAKENAKIVIENFYRYFNNQDLNSLFCLIADDVRHEINHAGVQNGKQSVIEYLNHSIEHYKEQVSDIHYMISDDGRFITTKFVVNGKYLKTDESKIPANGQNYHLDVINYFEIRNNQIIDAKCFFDEEKLMRQYRAE